VAAPVVPPPPAPDPPAPAEPRFNFRTETGITPGRVLVIVELLVDDPQNYNVRITDGTVLNRLEGRFFSNEVNRDVALSTNVIVTKK